MSPVPLKSRRLSHRAVMQALVAISITVGTIATANAQTFVEP